MQHINIFSFDKINARAEIFLQARPKRLTIKMLASLQ